MGKTKEQPIIESDELPTDDAEFANLVTSQVESCFSVANETLESGHKFPMGPKPTDGEYAAADISIKGLSPRQRINLHRLRRGLATQGAALENGALVGDDIGRAIRYLLESLG